MTISRIIVTMILAGVLLAPMAGNAKVGKYPDSPNVVVTEVGNNWIRIQTVGNKFRSDTHMDEVHSLAEYTCNLWDRSAVVLSQSESSPNLKWIQAGIPQTITIYFLIACALP